MTVPTGPVVPAAPNGGNGPVAAFLALPLGTRVVVRHRVGELATDALGLLVRRGAVDCDIRTNKGDVTVQLTDIIAAKQIPPPPPPRARRGPELSGWSDEGQPRSRSQRL